MKKIFAVVIFSVIVCSGAPTSLTAKPTTQKPIKSATAAQMKTFVALYAQFDKAFLTRDIRFLREKTAPDFTLRLFSDETWNRTKYLQMMTDFYREIIKVSSSTSKIEILSFRGKQAFVVSASVSEFTMRDPEKTVRRLKSMKRSSDIWTLTSRGWMIQKVNAISERQFIDGRESAFYQAKAR